MAAGRAAAAEPAGEEDVERLRSLSIEELANLQVVSVSRRSEPVAAAPAAVYVITPDDIRRSGAASLPEALRLAPNLQVTRVNSYVYAVSARGFNSFEASNKLLVQIDGRPIYSPVHSGVFWQNQDVMLADLARIEVVAGPGGALWGANAVNGVVNILSKPAADTQGMLVDAGGGPDERFANLRYGFKAGEDVAVRVFAGGFRRAELDPVAPSPIDLGFRGAFGGFRADRQSGDDVLTLQGDLYRNVAGNGEKLLGHNLTGRWRRNYAEDSNVRVQLYYDRFYRGQTPIYTETLHTWDLQAVREFTLGDHHLVMGGQYRRWSDVFAINPLLLLGFQRPHGRISISNLFIQDEFALAPNLRLTTGLKVEHSSYSGLDYMPSARLAWRPDEATLVWAAASRAVRTPNRVERELQLPGLLRPAPEYRSETATSVEAGYRGRPMRRATLSISVFYTRYDDIRTAEIPATGPRYVGNGLEGKSWGGEAWGALELTPNWRLKAGASWLEERFHLKPGSRDDVFQALGFDPKYQAQLRSEANLAPDVALDLALRAVGAAKDQRTGLQRTAAYVDADARLAWRLRPDVELSLAGFNLLHDSHLEYNNPTTSPVYRVPRTGYVGLRWDF